MTSRGQCPRGGACECPRVGAFFKLMTSRGQCPRGGGGAPGVPPIQVQTPTATGWLATGLDSDDILCHNGRLSAMCRPKLGNWPSTGADSEFWKGGGGVVT